MILVATHRKSTNEAAEMLEIMDYAMVKMGGEFQKLLPDSTLYNKGVSHARVRLSRKIR